MSIQAVDLKGLASLQAGGGTDQRGRKRSIMKKRVLFDRLGGMMQIKALCEKFFKYVKEDSRINFFFTTVDMNKLVE